MKILNKVLLLLNNQLGCRPYFDLKYRRHDTVIMIPPASIEGFNGQLCWIIPSDSEDISAACFVPLQKKYCHAYRPTGSGKLISKSGFFPCLLPSAERQALGPLLLHVLCHSGWLQFSFIEHEV
jgi:hypothetical protein